PGSEAPVQAQPDHARRARDQGWNAEVQTGVAGVDDVLLVQRVVDRKRQRPFTPEVHAAAQIDQAVTGLLDLPDERVSERRGIVLVLEIHLRLVSNVGTEEYLAVAGQRMRPVQPDRQLLLGEQSESVAGQGLRPA